MSEVPQNQIWSILLDRPFYMKQVIILLRQLAYFYNMLIAIFGLLIYSLRNNDTKRFWVRIRFHYILLVPDVRAQYIELFAIYIEVYSAQEGVNRN